MNPQGTSFIPQRPTQGNVKKKTVRKVYILTYISFALFFATVLGTVGTFAYTQVTQKKLDEQKKLLVEERKAFSESDMASVRELDQRIKNTQMRIDNHVSIVSIFKALEESTAQTLTLTDFEYKRVADEVPQISLKGETNKFNSILFQRNVLATNKVLSGASFSAVELATDSGTKDTVPKQRITFVISGEVDPSLIRFTPEITEKDDVVETAAVDTSSATEVTPSEVSDATDTSLGSDQ